ncbi:MAG: type II secretion system protein [Rhizonema sp. PD37]|nr:type II secretion system protein [Rhizonema sp. PD37]
MNNQSLSMSSEAGFTLLELLVVVIMVGILSAIAIPGWLGFINRQRLSTAQKQTLVLIRNAQANAQREKTSWQVCFSDDNTQVLSSVQPVPSDNTCSTTTWQPLIDKDSKYIKFTSTMSQSSNQYYRVQFNYDASVVSGQLGYITFTPRTTSNPKVCVSVKTLLGATLYGPNACN